MFDKKIILNIFLLSIFFEASLSQKNKCINPNRNSGLCVSIYYCNSLNKILHKGLLTEQDVKFLLESQCQNGLGPAPTVCCTKDEEYTNQQNSNGSKSPTTPTTIKPMTNDEYIQTQNANKDGTILPQLPYCGVSPLTQKIYNGKDAELGEYPWMGILQYRMKNGDIAQDCAGSLINSRYILTAAHCLTGKITTKIGQLISVKLGEHDLTKEIDCIDPYIKSTCADPPITVEIEEAIPHEQYDDTSVHRYHDIGLIRLKEYVNYTDYINAVCLPSANYERTAPGQKLIVSGWGRTTTARKSEIKQKLEIPVVAQDECTKTFATQRVHIIENQLCAGGVFYQDSCDGDSGGPLMREINSKGFIEGIVSFGHKCGLEGWPAIYTRVSNYENWIKSKLKP